MKTEVYVTGFDLAAELSRLGVSRSKMLFSDAHYVMPTEAWIKAVAGPALKRWTDQLTIGWTSERYDCDDFALLAKALVSLWHNDSTKEKMGITFGIVWEAGLGHAYNLVRHKDGWKAYEPQNGLKERALPQWQSVVFLYL